jgi:NAD(P)H-nitrite reductase large subunit
VIKMANVTIRVKHTEPFVVQADDDMTVCRCEEITKGEIRRAIYEGMRTFNEVKRYLRVGMGLCQGQTCQRLVLSIMSAELGLPVGAFGHISGRMPVRPVVLEELSKCGEHSEGVEAYVGKN